MKKNTHKQDDNLEEKISAAVTRAIAATDPTYEKEHFSKLFSTDPFQFVTWLLMTDATALVKMHSGERAITDSLGDQKIRSSINCYRRLIYMGDWACRLYIASISCEFIEAPYPNWTIARYKYLESQLLDTYYEKTNERLLDLDVSQWPLVAERLGVKPKQEGESVGS